MPAVNAKAKEGKTELRVGGKTLAVTNLEKVIYPKTGFTKGDVLDYYVRASPVLLPHLKGRPITLKRYPGGVEGAFFYEKQCPGHRPAWVKTAKVQKETGGEIDYCVMDGLPALVWAANLGDLELHTFLHHAPAFERPDFLVFDLDPGPPADVVACCRVARLLKACLDAVGLLCLAKTSGSKGLQVYVPLNRPAITYAETKEAARALAEALSRQYPELLVSRMQKELRRGKVLVDWSQNDSKKTTVCVYSLRAKDRPSVSTPVRWEEVDRCIESQDAALLVFRPERVLARVAEHGDLFGPALKLKQKLPAPGALASAAGAGGRRAG